jgi:HD-GYP domain-containing protein (c-di-GMP phosphodiesterase class II)
MSAVDLEAPNLASLIGSAGWQGRSELVQKVRVLDEPICTHADLVAASVELLAERFGFPICDHDALIDAAWLHDIGKLTISSEILNKPGPLDEEQWAEMRKHPDRGADFLATTTSLGRSAQMVRHHHERFDGGGYPAGLAGTEIPLGSRIICIVDAYDAMTTERPYCGAMSHGEALAEIRRCSGAQFDPEIVSAFISIFPTPKKGSGA